MTEEIKQGMTRREVLKKGAIVGGTMGAVMWVAPVVRAQTVAADTATVPSETSCCLKMVGLEAAFTPGGSGNDVTVTLKVQNCGTHSTDYAIVGSLQRLPWIGGKPDTTQAVSLPVVNVGSLLPGADNFPGDTYGDVDIPGNAFGDDYVYRSHGTYYCPDDPGNPPVGTPLNHNVPSSFWVYSNVINVS